jgi:hypothetical protein
MTKGDALKCWSTIEDRAEKIDHAIVTISPAVARRWLTCWKAFEQLKQEDPHLVGIVYFGLTPDVTSLEVTVFDDEDS